MESSKRPVPPDDELERALREAARRRRPGSLLVLFLVIVVLLGPLALFVWWTWPGGDPPRLGIVAADQLALPGEDTALSAFLVTIEPSNQKLDLSGYEVAFEESLTGPRRNDQPRRQRVQSMADGSATTSWRSPEKTGTVDVVARYLGDKKRRGAEDRARLFAWPADSPLLILDVPGVVSLLSASAWQVKHFPDIPARPEASKVLHAAQARKYRIAYLAIAPENPASYRKCRGWIMNQGFPAGPVLGRISYEQEESAAWEHVLRQLKERFRGPMLAVVGSSDVVAVCRSFGIRTAVLGDEKGAGKVATLEKLIDILDRK